MFDRMYVSPMTEEKKKQGILEQYEKELEEEDQKLIEDMTTHTDLFNGDGPSSDVPQSDSQPLVEPPVPQKLRTSVHLSQLYSCIQETVLAMGEEGDFPEEVVRNAIRNVYYRALDELMKGGILSDKIFGIAFDLKERIKKYLAETSKGGTKSEIIRAIGRNNSRYYDIMDFVLDHMVKSGTCIRKGKRYYLKV